MVSFSKPVPPFTGLEISVVSSPNRCVCPVFPTPHLRDIRYFQGWTLNVAVRAVEFS